MSQYTVSVKNNLRTELEPTVSGLQVGSSMTLVRTWVGWDVRSLPVQSFRQRLRQPASHP